MANGPPPTTSNVYKLQIICICQKTKWYTTQILTEQHTHKHFSSWLTSNIHEGLFISTIRMGFQVSRPLSKKKLDAQHRFAIKLVAVVVASLFLLFSSIPLLHLKVSISLISNGNELFAWIALWLHLPSKIHHQTGSKHRSNQHND